MDDAKLEAIANAIAAKVVEQLQRHEQVIPKYLTPAQLAILSGFTEKALENFRSRRIGPRFLKVRRSVRYRYEDVRAWLEQPADESDSPSPQHGEGRTAPQKSSR